MKKFFKSIFTVLTVFVVNICGIACYYSLSLPDSFYVAKGKNLEVSTLFSIKSDSSESVASFAGKTSPTVETSNLKLFGIIPIKEVELHKVETPILVPGGNPFGIKLLMEGVMVVGMGEVKTKDGTQCPAAECGIEEGDIIISLDGKKLSSNSDITEIVSKSDGEPLEIIYMDGEKERVSFLTPVYSLTECSYKAGMWVRDSMAGIGTVTFYEPDTGRFGGLGHPVCDSDTGEIVPISSGEAAEVEITDVKKGTSGCPGELHGCFISNRTSGVIYTNNKYGVFGELFADTPKYSEIPMALKQDAKEGRASIYTTIDENGPQEFEIEIVDIDYKSTDTRNMTIKVTDKRLLEKTGGIVQGMSGSPIIQNNKLIGAVTHVFVSDPQMGYGIFAENMYESGLTG